MSKINKEKYEEGTGRIFIQTVATINYDGHEFGIVPSENGLVIYMRGGRRKFHLEIDITEEVEECIKELIEGHKQVDKITLV